jgi:hypothetical protein
MAIAIASTTSRVAASATSSPASTDDYRLRVPPLRLFQFRRAPGRFPALAWPAKPTSEPFRPEIPFRPGAPRGPVRPRSRSPRGGWRGARAHARLRAARPAALAPLLLRVQAVGVHALRPLPLPRTAAGHIPLAPRGRRGDPPSSRSPSARRRTGFWRDEDTLFRTAALESPTAPLRGRSPPPQSTATGDVEVLRKAYDRRRRRSTSSKGAERRRDALRDPRRLRAGEPLLRLVHAVRGRVDN